MIRWFLQLVQKRILLCAILALTTVQIASATPSLFVTTGASSVAVIGVPGAVSFSSSDFGGWNLKVLFGTSNSPSASPFGIDLTTLSAECVEATCGNLDVWLSDTAFTQVNNNFVNAFVSNQTGSSSSVTQKAWVGLGNLLFQSDGSDGPPTVAGGSPIPSIGPFMGTGVFSASTSANISAGPGNYSLTIEDIFAGCNSGPNCATYSTDGSIEAPEPNSALLLGLGIFGLMGSLGIQRFRMERT
jgi:hypothetical protein